MTDGIDREEFFGHLDDLGEAQVRLMMTSGNWASQLHGHVMYWLAAKDRENQLLREASQAEQMEISRSAKDAAWAAAEAALEAAREAKAANTIAKTANMIATIALVAAAIAIPISIIAIFVR